MQSFRHFRNILNRKEIPPSLKSVEEVRCVCNWNHKRQFHFNSPHRTVEFTSVRYPKLKRGGYSRVEDRDVSVFERILPGGSRVITDPADLVGHNTDWIKTCRGYRLY